MFYFVKILLVIIQIHKTINCSNQVFFFLYLALLFRISTIHQILNLVGITSSSVGLLGILPSKGCCIYYISIRNHNNNYFALLLPFWEFLQACLYFEPMTPLVMCTCTNMNASSRCFRKNNPQKQLSGFAIKNINVLKNEIKILLTRVCISFTTPLNLPTGRKHQSSLSLSTRNINLLRAYNI